MIAASRRAPEQVSFAPVHVEAPASALPAPLSAAGACDGSIDITIGTATVRIRGAADTKDAGAGAEAWALDLMRHSQSFAAPNGDVFKAMNTLGVGVRGFKCWINGDPCDPPEFERRLAAHFRQS